MPSLIFIAEAMEAVRDVMKSCKMLMLTPLTENQKYFLKLLEKGSSVSTFEFLEKLPDKENDKLFRDLFDFASTQVSETIPKWVVWKYFGDSRHIKKSSEDIAQMNVSNNFHHALQLGHTLLPVKVVVIMRDKISALYENDGKRILIRNINQGRFKGKLRLRDYVLVHYAFVLEVRPSKSLVDSILEDQLKNKVFMAACGAVDLIDYDKLAGKLCI